MLTRFSCSRARLCPDSSHARTVACSGRLAAYRWTASWQRELSEFPLFPKPIPPYASGLLALANRLSAPPSAPFGSSAITLGATIARVRARCQHKTHDADGAVAYVANGINARFGGVILMSKVAHEQRSSQMAIIGVRLSISIALAVRTLASAELGAGRLKGPEGMPVAPWSYPSGHTRPGLRAAPARCRSRARSGRLRAEGGLLR